ncbi:hypothetical protein CCUG63695_03054 [Mycobacteroides franklinii]|uniref:Uncharacterized protein n=2 Tax=Mycobacteroides franklinii TaxID=948102 RepID=A0A4R8R4S9_9MYCO|nr:hypothetical protein CCUG64054_03127 [Mycobacteroides franklinii]TDZ50210.1 hypothetical protein CCUG63697_01712 [Mycobacteroides franklinii]TDZ56631.1 hypothetical protein CCUG63696_03129 [Mycobacteroides franklinii]TDZ63572.1 hypothetical protein CCUG63695_03054 [Mycobacteroides franklinii]TDZ69969.1 hypothetical protein CCUG64056_03127 [Mycobacteroides franklinii]
MDRAATIKALRIAAFLGGVAFLIYLVAFHDKNSSWAIIWVSVALVGLVIAATVLDESRRPTRKKVVIWVLCALLGLIALSAARMLYMERPVTVPRSETAETDFSVIPGQFPSSSALINPDFPQKTCVSLYGSQAEAKVERAGCGSTDNNFIVVQQVQKPAECVGDVDQKYYSNTARGGEWALCLDYYWVQSSCLSMNGFDVKRVLCNDASRSKKEKPVRLIKDSTSISNCPSGGYEHPVRRFTVCTETQQ